MWQAIVKALIDRLGIKLVSHASTRAIPESLRYIDSNSSLHVETDYGHMLNNGHNYR
jgi:hypothetical protein